jgi:hypothetical protein
MFKLGEYYEDVARDIATHLKDAGMKVDIRTFTAANVESFDFLEGRMSELKEELEETRFSRYERYINALRAVLAKGATSDNFRELFQIEIDPEVNEKRQQFREAISGDLSEEDLKIKKQNFASIMKDLMNVSNAESFVETQLNRNGIKIGEDVGDRLDDPIIRIFYDPEEDEEDHRLARITTTLTFNPKAEVFIDEFSATLVDELDEEFREEYDEELFKIEYLAEIISNLKKSSSGKMGAETFYERCTFQLEDEGNILKVDGKRAGQEIARSLEKNGVIKVKGDIIKWKH